VVILKGPLFLLDEKDKILEMKIVADLPWFSGHDAVIRLLSCLEDQGPLWS